LAAIVALCLIALVGAAIVAIRGSGPPSEFEVARTLLARLGTRYGIDAPSEPESADEILAEFGAPWGFAEHMPTEELKCGGWDIVVLDESVPDAAAAPKNFVFIDVVGGIPSGDDSVAYSFGIYVKPRSLWARMYSMLWPPRK